MNTRFSISLLSAGLLAGLLGCSTARVAEPCLLSTKSCTDKAAEPMLTAPKPRVIPAPRVESL